MLSIIGRLCENKLYAQYTYASYNKKKYFKLAYEQVYFKEIKKYKSHESLPKKKVADKVLAEFILILLLNTFDKY